VIAWFISLEKNRKRRRRHYICALIALAIWVPNWYFAWVLVSRRFFPEGDGRDFLFGFIFNFTMFFGSNLAFAIGVHKWEAISASRRGVLPALRCIAEALLTAFGAGVGLMLMTLVPSALSWAASTHFWRVSLNPTDQAETTTDSASDPTAFFRAAVQRLLWWLSVAITGVAYPLAAEILVTFLVQIVSKSFIIEAQRGKVTPIDKGDKLRDVVLNDSVALKLLFKNKAGDSAASRPNVSSSDSLRLQTKPSASTILSLLEEEQALPQENDQQVDRSVTSVILLSELEQFEESSASEMLQDSLFFIRLLGRSALLKQKSEPSPWSAEQVDFSPSEKPKTVAESQFDSVQAADPFLAEDMPKSIAMPLKNTWEIKSNATIAGSGIMAIVFIQTSTFLLMLQPGSASFW
jgi:hypothetical protein